MTAKNFEVIDNRIQLDQAIWACRLQESLSKQRLHYFVAKERDRRQKAIEDANVRCLIPGPTSSRAGMIVDMIPRPPAPKPGGVEEDNVTVTSPLTSSGMTTTSTVFEDDVSPAANREKQTSKIKKTRKSRKQASEARIEEKKARDSLNQRYSVAFKKATILLSSENRHLKATTTEGIIHQLNEEHCLNGTKKKLAKSTIYGAIARGNVGMSPMKKGPPPKIPHAL